MMPMQGYIPDDAENNSNMDDMQNWWYCKGQAPPDGFYADPWHHEGAFSLSGECSN